MSYYIKNPKTNKTTSRRVTPLIGGDAQNKKSRGKTAAAFIESLLENEIT